VAKNVAQRIDERREALGLSITQFATEVGVSKSTACDWVHGTHEPNLTSLRKIAKALKCDVSTLLGVA
jgi:transcriptional regulator with XRE-family HTH domain